jgi:hypothetical protein
VILSPRIATSGIIIEQKTTIRSAGAPGEVANRTLILQGDQEKFLFDDRISVVLNADNQTATILDRTARTFHALPLGKILGTMADPNRLLYVTFRSTDETRELLGSKCQDYTNMRYHGATLVVTNACFSTQATGSDDFSRFIKSMVRNLRLPERWVSIPAGLPLEIESTRKGNLAYHFPDLSVEQEAHIRSTIAHIPTDLTQVVVTRITSEKLAPDVFNTPVGYTRIGPPNQSQRLKGRG